MAACWRSEEHAGQRHSELILPMIDALLQRRRDRAGCLRRDRVRRRAGLVHRAAHRLRRCARAGLCDEPCRWSAVGTLLAVAQASGAERVIVCLDARMGEVYAAAFERDGQRLEHGPLAMLVLSGQQRQRWRAQAGSARAAASQPTALLCRLATRIILPRCVRTCIPHARDIASLAADSVRAGLAVPAEQAHPIYLRDRVALTVSERRAIKAQQNAAAAATNR